MSTREINDLREYILRNAKGLISPATSGLIIAAALFELADAQRESTDQLRRFNEELLARGRVPT